MLGTTEEYGDAQAAAGVDRFMRLAEAVRRLCDAQTSDEIVETVRASARGLCGAAGIAVVLREDDECHYVAEDSAVSLWTGQRFPVSHCISGWAMLNRQQVQLENIYDDPRVPHEAYRPTGIKSLVMTPVGAPEPFAALGAYWLEARRHTAEEAAILQSLAQCMAAAFRTIDLRNGLETRLEEVRRSDQRRRLLINELNHRVKNSLAVVQSIAHQTLPNDGPSADARQAFHSRLHALAQAHGLVMESGWGPVAVRPLAQTALRPFAGEAAERIELDGPELIFAPSAAVTLSLALHELGTNAVKYGALSTLSGRVRLAWRQVDERVVIEWVESGGPAVRAPSGRGFGVRMIEQGLARELGGQVELAFDPEGLRLRLEAPAESVVLPAEEAAALAARTVMD